MDSTRSRDIKKMFLFSWLLWTVANMAHPITPAHFTNLNFRANLYGVTTGLMTLGMVIGAPTWGAISDSGYRVNVVWIVMTIYGLAQIGMGLATSIPIILIVRFIAGLCSAAFNLSLMSIISDLSDGSNRAENITIYGAIMGVGTPTGYLLGGLLGLINVKLVFFIQGIMAILIALGVFFTIENTNSDDRGQMEIKTIFTVVREAKSNESMFSPWVITFLFMVLFGGFGYGIVNTVFNFYLNSTLGLSPVVNGVWRAGVGIVGLGLNLTLNIWLVRNMDLKKVVIWMALVSGFSGYLVFISSSGIIFFIMNLIFMISYVIQQPVMQSFAVDASRENVGLMTSIYNVVKSLGEMMGQFTSGWTYEIFSRLPFLLSGISYTALAIIMFLWGKKELEIEK